MMQSFIEGLAVAIAVGMAFFLAVAIKGWIDIGGSMWSRKKRKSGRLIVSGKGSVVIPIEFQPKKVLVGFVEPCVEYITCVPTCEDKLEYLLKNVNDCMQRPALHASLLVLEWDVESVKEIAWEVKNHLG